MKAVFPEKNPEKLLVGYLYVQLNEKEMILKSIEYIENKGLPEEWQVGCILNDINLMVGRNATKKMVRNYENKAVTG